MFTGIIEQMGEILDINNGVFIIENMFSDTLSLGQSIAHDGACMTITDFGNNYQTSGKKRYSFFVMQESFSKTNFGKKKIGDSFNLERSIIYGQRVDGHMVTGHIDETAEVHKIIHNKDGSWNFSILVDRNRIQYVIKKGSIAINGVSLTIAEIKKDDFMLGKQKIIITVCLIPYTWVHSNLGNLVAGDIVNIEFDMIGKYIVKETLKY